MIPQIGRAVSGGLLAIGRIALAVMLLVTLADVIGRNLLGRPLSGVVDMVELALAASIFAGIAIACRRGVHLAVDLLEVVLGPRLLRGLDRVNDLVSFICCLGLAWLARAEFLDKAEWGDTTVDLGIPLTWYWSTVVIGFAAATLFCAGRLFSPPPPNGDSAS
jgi:TRAP-type C4-dicarboxylate transport system permease small subunit